MGQETYLQNSPQKINKIIEALWEEGEIDWAMHIVWGERVPEHATQNMSFGLKDCFEPKAVKKQQMQE